MRVVHVSLARGFRGGEQQALYLIVELARRGVEQVVVARRGEPLAARLTVHPKVEVVEVGNRATAARALARIARVAVDDTIGHAHDGHAHTALWGSGLLGARMRYVVSRRVLRAPSPPRSSSGKYAFGRLRALLCVSEAVAAAHRGRLAETGLEICVVYDAALRPAGERVPDLRLSLGLAPGTVLVGTVAALAPEKDGETFVKTCALVGTRWPGVHFVHVGGGTGVAAAEFEAAVRAAGLAGRMHALGFREDATALIGALDVFLFTSRWEGLGSALLEAQLRSVPVVSTAAGGTVEIVADGVSGLLAPVGAADVLAKAVGAILGDASLRERLVGEARAQTSRFSVAALAEGTLLAYQAALTGA